MVTVQAHLLRIVDPVTKQPLTLDRLEDEASIMFVAGMLFYPTLLCCPLLWLNKLICKQRVANLLGISRSGLFIRTFRYCNSVMPLGFVCRACISDVLLRAHTAHHGMMTKVGAHAGSETTGYSIAWTLYLLAKHPEVMAKLEAELDAAGLLVTPARPRPRPLAFADISKLRYMDCVLKARLFAARLVLLPLAGQ